MFALPFIWLSHQASASLAVTGGFLTAPLLLQLLLPEAPEQKRRGEKKKLGEWKVANGEAHRQEVGVISSGSYQSHFLYDLSDEKRERERESKAERRRE